MIKKITLKEHETWDEIVKSFKEHDIYYLSGYTKAFETHGDGVPILIYFENGKTRAINVVMERDIASIPRFRNLISEGALYDVSTPYGYGGPIIEGDNWDTFTKEYIRFANDNNWVSEFVRFHPNLENWKKVSDLYNISFSGNTITVETLNEETIWENLTSKNRNMIRKAQKSGIKTYWTNDASIIPQFVELYNDTMDRDCASDYYYFNESFYDSIVEDLKYNSMFFYTKIDNNIVAIAIFLFINGRMHYHLSASKKEYQKFAPTNMLLHEAARWAACNGYKTLHLGGGRGASEDSLYKFKKAFYRKDDTSFFVGKKIYNEEKYNELVEMCCKDSLNNNYFPLYRG